MYGCKTKFIDSNFLAKSQNIHLIYKSGQMITLSYQTLFSFPSAVFWLYLMPINSCFKWLDDWVSEGGGGALLFIIYTRLPYLS